MLSSQSPQEKYARRHGTPGVFSGASSARLYASKTLIGSASISSRGADPRASHHTSSVPTLDSVSNTLAASWSESQLPLAFSGSYGTSSAPSDTGSDSTSGANSSLPSRCACSQAQDRQPHRRGGPYTAYGPNGEVQPRHSSPNTSLASETRSPSRHVSQ